MRHARRRVPVPNPRGLIGQGFIVESRVGPARRMPC